jgi:hypothetical protein
MEELLEFHCTSNYSKPSIPRGFAPNPTKGLTSSGLLFDFKSSSAAAEDLRKE